MCFFCVFLSGGVSLLRASAVAGKAARRRLLADVSRRLRVPSSDVDVMSFSLPLVRQWVVLEECAAVVLEQGGE